MTFDIQPLQCYHQPPLSTVFELREIQKQIQIQRIYFETKLEPCRPQIICEHRFSKISIIETEENFWQGLLDHYDADDDDVDDDHHHNDDDDDDDADDDRDDDDHH